MLTQEYYVDEDHASENLDLAESRALLACTRPKAEYSPHYHAENMTGREKTTGDC
jgi:hypothetical protein